MSGIGVLLVIGLYFFIAYKIVGALKTKRLKWLAVVILALIPTADAVVGRVYLQHLCATEGGLKVNRVVNGVEGFIGAFGVDVEAVEKYGYKFSESSPWNGRVDRYSKVNGQMINENNVTPKSKFRVRLLNIGERDIYIRQMLVVETFPSEGMLAAHAQIGFSGGWAERFVALFGSGSRTWCKSQDSMARYRELIASSLKQ